MPSHSANDEAWAVEEKYTPDQDRTLSEAIIDAIDKHKETDVTKSNFVLYDSIDPDALDNLFRAGTTPNAIVEFNVDDIRVRCWGDGGVMIRVKSISGA